MGSMWHQHTSRPARAGLPGPQPCLHDLTPHLNANVHKVNNRQASCFHGSLHSTQAVLEGGSHFVQRHMKKPQKSRTASLLCEGLPPPQRWVET